MEALQDSGRRRALTFLVVGALSSGFSGVLIKLCRFPPATIAAFRMVLAGAVLAPFCIGAWRRLLAERGIAAVLPLLVPGILLGLHFQAWVTGLKHTTVANASFVFSINPVFFALAERFVRRRRVPPYALVSLALVVAGAWWLFVERQGSLGRRGDLLCLLSTLLFVAYLFVSRRVSMAEQRAGAKAAPIPHHLYVHIVYLGGGLATLPMALIGGQLGRIDLRDAGSALALLALALLPTLVGHTAHNYAVRWLPPLTVSFFTLAEPILATVAAALVLAEVPSLEALPTYVLFLVATVFYLVRSRGGPLQELPKRESNASISGRRKDSSR